MKYSIKRNIYNIRNCDTKYPERREGEERLFTILKQNHRKSNGLWKVFSWEQA